MKNISSVLWRECVVRSLIVSLLVLPCLLFLPDRYYSEEPSSGGSYASQYRILKEKADEGDSDALVELGLLIEKYRDDSAEAAGWYRRAADAGNVRGLFRMGIAHLEGRGLPRSGPRAEQYLKQAADKGFVPAQTALADLYMDPSLPPVNAEVAWSLYQQAAANGHPPAQHRVAMTYLNAQRYPEAISWLQKAVDKGFAPSQALLGTLYFNGTGVPSDRNKAFNLLEQAADQNDPQGMYMLSLYYLPASNREQVQKGFDLLFKAAEAGNINAQLLLAQELRTGQRIKPDQRLALKWAYIALQLVERSDATEQQKNELRHKVKMEHEASLDYNTRTNTWHESKRWIENYRPHIWNIDKARLWCFA